MNASLPSSAPSVPALDITGGIKFSDELQYLVVRFRDMPVSLADVLDATRGRGYYFVLVLIAVPFVTPIPLPGFSLPFGFAVAALGTRLLWDRGPWLPQRLLQRKMAPRFFGRVLSMAGKVMRVLEVFVRPRLGFVSSHVVFSRIAGLLIAIAGLMLMLPFPLPLSNSLPAWTVILLSAAALGRDGLLFFAGCGAFLLSVAFFALLAVGGTEAIDAIRWVFGI